MPARDRTADDSCVQELVAVGDGALEDRATDEPCLECILSRSWDDDTPSSGRVRWSLRRTGRLTIGTPISFECSQGHSSDADPALLKAFRSRLF